MGLKRSYNRGEATETSDIDTVVILNELSAHDIILYNNMLDTLENREFVCGFLSGKNELINWEPSDLFQFYHDTKSLIGTLDCLLPLIDEAALKKAIKLGACNIYHGCVHNMLYEKNEKILRGLYKSASFILQAIYFKQAGKYIKTQKELSKYLCADDRYISDTFSSLKNGGAVAFDEMSERLFTWSKKQIENI